MSSNEPIEQPAPQSPWQPLPQPDAVKPGPPPRQQAIAWLALALAIVILAVGSSPFWAPGIAQVLPWGQRPAATDHSASDTIRALQTRLDADETALKQQAANLPRLDAAELALKDQARRIAAIETRPAPTPQPPQAPAARVQSADSAAAIKILQDQLAKLATSTSATGDRLAKLETQIERADASGRADRALLLALANLRVAVEGSAPFTAELGAAQAIAGDKSDAKPALASLADEAKTGLPSLATLTERFDRRVAPAILRARGDTANEDWWQQIKARLERLVVVRRITPGATEPTDATEASVATADAALRAGDLAGAVAALENLTGTRATAAAAWLAGAKKRLAAEATLNKLWQAESARVAAASATKTEGSKP